MTASAHYSIFKGQDGGYYYHLVASNGQILAVSESYRTKWGAKRGAKASKRAFAEAEVPTL
jgi:uncharacterized protein YegP (UPF0339 family)